jgi:hypothetical protein
MMNLNFDLGHSLIIILIKFYQQHLTLKKLFKTILAFVVLILKNI